MLGVQYFAVYNPAKCGMRTAPNLEIKGVTIAEFTLVDTHLRKRDFAYFLGKRKPVTVKCRWCAVCGMTMAFIDGLGDNDLWAPGLELGGWGSQCFYQ